MQFERIVRRDKKAFLSKQCKEIEENNRMGKTRDLFKKISNTKGTFHKLSHGNKASVTCSLLMLELPGRVDLRGHCKYGFYKLCPNISPKHCFREGSAHSGRPVGLLVNK